MKLSFSIHFLGWWLTGQKWLARGQHFPQPSISLSPKTPIAQGGNVYIHCKTENYWRKVFELYKVAAPPLRPTFQSQTAAWPETTFHIPNTQTTTGGLYFCRYCFIRLSSGQLGSCSNISDSVKIYITDHYLPKPSIKARPGEDIAPGLNITIECQGPEEGLNFSLYKSSTLIASQITEPNSNTTKFSFSMVNFNDTGNYTCQYWNRTRPFVWSSPSDLIQIVVRGKDPVSLDRRLMQAGAAAGSLFLVLLLLLLAFILYRKRKKGSTANERPQPLPVKEANMPLEPEAEDDPSGVSYAVLKLQSPNTKQAANSDRLPESCVYASVANDRTRKGQ